MEEAVDAEDLVEAALDAVAGVFVEVAAVVVTEAAVDEATLLISSRDLTLSKWPLRRDLSDSRSLRLCTLPLMS